MQESLNDVLMYLTILSGIIMYLGLCYSIAYQVGKALVRIDKIHLEPVKLCFILSPFVFPLIIMTCVWITTTKCSLNLWNYLDKVFLENENGSN